MFEEHRQSIAAEDAKGLPPRHYPEWDYASQSYRPDWVSLYERLHPSGNAADIDQLLAKHSALAKRLKRLLDLLKPQDKVRVRYQEEGSELDLDVAIRSPARAASETVHGADAVTSALRYDAASDPPSNCYYYGS